MCNTNVAKQHQNSDKIVIAAFKCLWLQGMEMLGMSCGHSLWLCFCLPVILCWTWRDQTVHRWPRCLGFLWKKNRTVDKKMVFTQWWQLRNQDCTHLNPSPRSFSYFFWYCLTSRSTKFQIFGRNSINRSDNSFSFETALNYLWVRHPIHCSTWHSMARSLAGPLFPWKLHMESSDRRSAVTEF